MSDRTGVTLVIPAWNEAEAIGAVLDEVPRDLVDQVLVVVGGPSDPTAEAARKHGARVLVQRGRLDRHRDGRPLLEQLAHRRKGRLHVRRMLIAGMAIPAAF